MQGARYVFADRVSHKSSTEVAACATTARRSFGAAGIATERTRITVSIVTSRPTECDASSGRVVVTVAGAGVAPLQKLAMNGLGASRGFPPFALDSSTTASSSHQECRSSEVPDFSKGHARLPPRISSPIPPRSPLRAPVPLCAPPTAERGVSTRRAGPPCLLVFVQ